MYLLCMTREKVSQEVLNEIKLYQSQDYDITDETPEYFKLKRNRATFIGHVLVFLFTVWWTFGIGNLIYWISKSQTKKIMK